MSWPRAKVQPLEIDGLRIDAAISEQHTYGAEVTEYPVESGGAVVDHVRLMPIELKVEGVVSDTPIGDVADQRNSSRVTIEVEGREPQDITPRPVELALGWLVAIWSERRPVEILTSLTTYDRMVLTSLEFPRDARYGEAVRFEASFRQISFIDVVRTEAKTSTPGSGKKKKKGAIPPPRKRVQIPPGPNGKPQRLLDPATGVWQDSDTGLIWRGAFYSKRDGRWLFYRGEQLDNWEPASEPRKTFVEQFNYDPDDDLDAAVDEGGVL